VGQVVNLRPIVNRSPPHKLTLCQWDNAPALSRRAKLARLASTIKPHPAQSRRVRMVVPRHLLIPLERVINDRAQRSPPAQRRDTPPQRVRTHGQVRKVAARLRPGRVDRASVPIQEDTAVLAALQNSGGCCIPIRFGIPLPDFLRTQPKVAPNGFHLSLPYAHHRIPAAIRARGAVHVLLDLHCQDLKRFHRTVMRGQVTAECHILRLLGCPQPSDFGQVGDHAFSILPRIAEEKRPYVPQKSA